MKRKNKEGSWGAKKSKELHISTIAVRTISTHMVVPLKK